MRVGSGCKNSYTDDAKNTIGLIFFSHPSPMDGCRFFVLATICGKTTGWEDNGEPCWCEVLVSCYPMRKLWGLGEKILKFRHRNSLILKP